MSATKVKTTLKGSDTTKFLYFLNNFTVCLLGSPEDVSILCAGKAYGGSVNNWHQFLYVFHQHPIEKPLIPLLDAHQVDVSVRKTKKN